MLKKLSFLARVKTIFKHKILRLIAGLLVLAVCLFIVNNVVFLHPHKLPDGNIIVHAHPYNKSQDSAPFKAHSHTTKELFHIANMQLLFITAALFILFTQIANYKRVYLYQTPFVNFKYFFRLKGREPPYFKEV